MINCIPVIGWLISAAFSFCIAVPFYFLWNWLAPTYFYWLPKVYLAVPFWHCVGLFMLMPMLKILVVPKFASASATNTAAKPKAATAK